MPLGPIFHCVLHNYTTTIIWRTSTEPVALPYSGLPCEDGTIVMVNWLVKCEIAHLCI